MNKKTKELVMYKCIRNDKYEKVKKGHFYEYAGKVCPVESGGYDIALKSDDGYIRIYHSKNFVSENVIRARKIVEKYKSFI